MRKKSCKKPEVKHELSAFSQRSQNQGSITEVLKEVHIHPSLKLKSSSLWCCSKYKIHWKCEVITSHQSIYLALQKGVVEAEVPGLRVVSALPRTQVGTVWCLQLSCEVHPCSGKFQLGEVHILGTVKEEVTVPSVPHPPSLALKSIVHSSSFKSKCHIDKSIVEMCWKLGSKSLLQVLLKSHPNSKLKHMQLLKFMQKLIIPRPCSKKFDCNTSGSLIPWQNWPLGSWAICSEVNLAGITVQR